MIGDKQNQKVSSNSTAIQAGGDVNIGLQMHEVKELCYLFLKQNFPALREEAVNEAKNNVTEFAVQLEKKIIDRSGQIFFDKFKDPDVQAAINDAVQASARKGRRCNPDVLVGLIAERLAFSSNDFKDIVLSESVNIVPKLTCEQINYLSFIHYITQCSVEGLQHLSQLEHRSKPILNLISNGFDLSHSQKRHLEYAGTCSILAMMRVDIYAAWQKQYSPDSDVSSFKLELAVFSPSTKILLDQFDKENVGGQVNLTSVGYAIAIANLSKVLGTMDYSIWIK